MRINIRCPGFCHMNILPYLQSAQTPKVVIGVLLLAGFLCIVSIAIVETKHVMTRLTAKPERLRGKTGNVLTVAVKTDIENPSLHYGIVVDCGSSGSRVYVYFWPPHGGNVHELLNIQQMRDGNGDLVVKKIEPGISVYADNPASTISYLQPLVEFASKYVPEDKHKETPLYIMATAGLRMLSDEQQKSILGELRKGIPQNFNFLFTDSHAEVITGKQEGVFAWISMNYVLGKFEHMVGDDALSLVNVPGVEEQTHIRKRTTGIIDMGGGSVQIAFEVPQSVRFTPKEELAKGLLAEFNLGCRSGDMEHKYRIYVSTFLGFGGNEARKRYEKLLITQVSQNSHHTANNLRSADTLNTSNSISGGVNPADYPTNQNYMSMPGSSEYNPVSDPCLPVGMTDLISSRGQKIHIKGTGDYLKCQSSLKPLLNSSVACMKEPCSFNGVYQPEIDSRNSEFYGFSEFYYTMEDILHIAGSYDFIKFQKAASDYCATEWSTIQQWSEENIHPRADRNRYRLQCFKSAWITTVFHDGFGFPKIYKSFSSAQLVNGKDVHWGLGALLYKTRYYPLSDIQRHESHRYRPIWDVSQLPQSYNLLVLCVIIVLIAILIYVRRLKLVQTASTSLHKVPTMSYFMTEQDQLEDGVLIKNYGNSFYS